MGKEIDNIIENTSFAGTSLEAFCEEGVLPLLERAVIAITKVREPDKQANLYIQLAKLLLAEKQANHAKKQNDPDDQPNHQAVIDYLRK